MNHQLWKTSVLLLFCLVFLNCATQQTASEYVIVVKVPPHPTNNQVSMEEQYWRGRKLLFPQITIPDPISLGVPNDHSVMLVTIEKTGNIKLYSDVVANLSNTEGLRLLLKDNFDLRAKLGVYEPESEKVLTATVIKADMSLKYEDVMKVIAVVEASGSNPIGLQIDELSR